jgi:CheY-like chemotaxis protein
VANRDRNPAPPRVSGPHARLLAETLGRLASPEVVAGVLLRALSSAGLTGVPEDSASFASFACGPLCDAVEKALGEEASEAVLADLNPAFAAQQHGTSSGVRRRERHSLAPPRENAPIVLIASAKPAEIDALVPRLRERAKVVAAYDIFALLSAAQKYLTTPLTLLLNDEMPAIRASTLATLARVLPSGTKVIVWGNGQIEPDAREGAQTVEWLRLGPVEDLDAVADVCLAHLPRSFDEVVAERPSAAPKILVAHDDPAWRARVVRQLEAAGYAPTTAPDGFMALERCIDEQPAAVIAGLRMSSLDGAQLAALLRSRFGGETPPVILVAAGPLPEPPAGVVALLGEDAPEADLLAEVAVWAGPGTST